MQKVQHQCKLPIVILDNDWQKDNENVCRPMISCKALIKILYGNSENMRKNGFKKHTPAIFLREFFMFVLAEAARAISAF